MVKQGNEVAWWPIGNVQMANPNAQKVYQQCVDNQGSYDANAPSLKIWHQFDLAQHVGGWLHCALPIFELDSFRSVEETHLKQQDLIFATSKWHKKVLEDNREINQLAAVEVAPLGVDSGQPSSTVANGSIVKVTTS
jgi:hypothetical protein